MKPDAADNPVPREISALLSNERLILRETQRSVTPLGGATVFVVFLHKLGLVEKIRRDQLGNDVGVSGNLASPTNS